MKNFDFYNGKNVFVTGHTGFKGSWLCRMLINAGANVTGYALEPENPLNLFDIADIKNNINSMIGDIRNRESLRDSLEKAKPEIVFHLAAQPIVRKSYASPAYTYETNVMGTVNILECALKCNTVRSVVNITTDKVYRNNEQSEGYCESDFLDGYDPYSNSKSCSELVTHSYNRCFFKPGGIALSTARAGNVIGGGDFAEDRIIPDCVRSALNNKKIIVRNPFAIRPFQHVIEPLAVYLMIAQKQYENIKYADSYNIGPDENDCITVEELVKLFCSHWGENIGFEIVTEKNAPHEANFLKLDCSKLKKVFDWKPVWNIEQSVKMICRFSKKLSDSADIPEEMDREIKEYMEE
ncbi:MAG: CDP-glucose 4,6-dehydratase [Clostridium sp.]|nr:CDP-glucose 4,6-dehydratase [Clostridium sp.]